MDVVEARGTNSSQASKRIDCDGARSAADDPIVIAGSMRELYRVVGRLAQRTLPILITGETGVGKEIVACAVHKASARSGPLKVVNCAEIPVALAESILFGHERGAFTGAEARSAGLFEAARGGTLFLDEIGELPASAQAALLRALQQKRIVRLGSTQELAVDVRIIAATHRDLGAMVQRGEFRKDLLYRLNAVTLDVPPLRERVAEIVPLAERFIIEGVAQWGGITRRMSPEVAGLLEAYAWPGNIRELRNTIERAVALCDHEVLGVADLPSWMKPASPTDPQSPDDESTKGYASFRQRMRELETTLIRTALDKSHGNHTLAARALGMPIRTLTYKVRSLGLKSPKSL